MTDKEDDYEPEKVVGKSPDESSDIEENDDLLDEHSEEDESSLYGVYDEDEDIEDVYRRSLKPDKKNMRSQLLTAALESQIVEYQSKRRESLKTLDDLASIIEEFTDSFILLGYDFKGNPVNLISAQTQQQADSLGTLVHKFLVEKSLKGPGGL